MKLTDHERRALTELEARLGAAFDLRSKGPLDESTLEQLRESLGAWGCDARPELSKLADLRKHLTREITQRTLQSLIVPVERALKRAIQDDDFLIRREDRDATEGARVPLSLVLDHLRSAFNVGSLFRTAEGLGLEKIWLTGYSPPPTEIKSSKAALGSELRVPWESRSSTAELLRELKACGSRIVALETAGSAVPLAAPFEKVPTVLVLGNERFGLEADVLALCDEIRELPLAGAKNSLNVAVLGALAAYEWKAQWTR